MPQLLVTLVGEAASDAALVWIVRWLLRDLLHGVSIQGACANRTELPSARNLTGRIVQALRGQPCDILFVHRDADTAGRDPRVEEIARAGVTARSQMAAPIPIVPIVPVRMGDAWLLTDQDAIRRAAGNPNGRMPLDLPRGRDLERLPNPKRALADLMRTASGLHGQRLRRFEPDTVAVAEVTVSFASSRRLPAFRAFEEDVRRVIDEQGWPTRR